MITVGSFQGEFGWLLMRWQGHLRHLSKDSEIKVRCLPWQRYLFEDFASVIETAEELHSKKNMWEPSEMGYSITPCEKLCSNNHLKQDFIHFGEKNYSGRFNYDVIVHARNCGRKCDALTGDRNYKYWKELSERLPISASVGSLDESDFVGGVDLRGIPLKTLAKVLANTKLIIGPSSGLLHYASLCGTPHLVWSDRRKWNLGVKKGTNWERYTKVWNPLCTPAHVIDDEPDPWQPSVERILRAIDKNQLL